MPSFTDKIVTDNLTMAHTTWKAKETGKKGLSYEFQHQPFTQISHGISSYSLKHGVIFIISKKKFTWIYLTALPKPCVHHGPCLLTIIFAVPFQSSPKPHFVHTESSKTFGPLH